MAGKNLFYPADSLSRLWRQSGFSKGETRRRVSPLETCRKEVNPMIFPFSIHPNIIVRRLPLQPAKKQFDIILVRQQMPDCFR